MIVDACLSTVLDANCYVVARGEGDPALVIDPGVGTADAVAAIVKKWNLTIGAVLCTHGHLDHVWDAAEVAGRAPVYVPGPDLYRMDDPGSVDVMGPQFAPLVEHLPHPWVKPTNLHAVPDEAVSGGVELVEGVPVRMLPAPGHSEGSSLFFVAGPVTAGNRAGVGASPILCFDGDVIFAGSVGRTDLPGGDQRLMLQTLRTLLNVVDPQTVLFPGHGPATTMERQAQSNPYLNEARHVG